MPRTRVLVVDDSVVVRRMLTEAIGAEPLCEVVGTASNGKIAIARIAQLQPDVVTLDVEMPEMDGLATLVELRKLHPRLPVIMFSAVTERAATATLKALALGATDYVTKPSVGNLEAAIAEVRAQLVPKILIFGGQRSPVARSGSMTAVSAARPAEVLRPASPAPRPSAIEVIGIGASTGGPNALAQVIAGLRGDIGVPILLTQHMPPLFTRLLAERLDAASPLTVREGVHGEPVERGHVYVAPGDHHIGLRREGTSVRLVVHQGPQENSCRPAVDVMFRSMVEMYGGRMLAVILTGMGQDGLKGCELLRRAGGQIVVQDEASSVVWGMPGFVARAGLADAVLPLDQVSAEIDRRLSRAPALHRAHTALTTGQ